MKSTIKHALLLIITITPFILTGCAEAGSHANRSSKPSHETRSGRSAQTSKRLPANKTPQRYAAPDNPALPTKTFTDTINGIDGVIKAGTQLMHDIQL